MLGALGDDTNTTGIIAQICPSGIGKSPCTTENIADDTSFFTSAITTRFLPAYTTATGASSASACEGISAPSTLQTATTYGAVAAGGTAAIGGALATAGVLSATVPIVGAIAGAILGIVSIFTGHHAAAVKEQDAVLCQAVPAVNSLLSQIDAALAAGSISPSDANAQYSSLLSQFMAALQADSSYKMGDAPYGYGLALQMVIAQRIADLSAGVLTSGAPGPWTQVVSPGSGIVGSIESALGISSAPASTAAAPSFLAEYWPWILGAGVAAALWL